MKVIFKSPIGFFSADTAQSVKQIPAGKLWMHTVQFTAYELDGAEEAMDNVEFTIAAALPDALKQQGETVHGNLLARMLRQLAEHVEANRDNLS